MIVETRLERIRTMGLKVDVSFNVVWIDRRRRHFCLFF